MKNLFTIFRLLIFIALYTHVSSQAVSDALRYSYFNTYGSARSAGVAGSMAAIGGDFGALHSNIAGLAGYKFSEIAFSPTLYFNQTNSSLKSTGYLKDNKYGSSIDHLGLVVVRNNYAGAKWKQVNYSIGFNRLADFNKSFYFDGATTGSITDHWREKALKLNSDALDDFGAGLAYEAGAIFDSNGDKVYESDFIDYANKPVQKSQTVNYKGGLNELSFGLAGNYKDFLLIGAGIGIPMINYIENKTYSESDPTNLNPVFENLQYTEYVKTDGNGINLKLGAILKLHNMFRLGFSLQTPTLFEQNDTYETSISYSYLDKGKVTTYDKQSPKLGQYTYNLLTPARFGLSFASVVGRAGFIAASMEYVNYKGAEFDFVDANGNSTDIEVQNNLNKEISRQYQAALNYNLGAEIALDDLRLRGGVRLLGSPYSNDNDLTKILSAGLGYRAGKFIFDVALQHTRYDDGYIPYNTATNDVQLVNNKYQLNRLIMTLGYKIAR